jgi:branched-subunit amino acid transport protein AzlD
VSRAVLVSVLVMAAITFALRALPFVALRRFTDSAIVHYVGAVMPPGVMVILVAYNVSSVHVAQRPYGVPVAAGVLATVAVHHWRRNALLSIVSGTALHVALLHLLA